MYGVSGQHIGPIFKRQERRTSYLHRGGSLRSRLLRLSEEAKRAFFLDVLAFEEGTDRLSRNVGVELPLNAA
jgi:hypothetical protein